MFRGHSSSQTLLRFKALKACLGKRSWNLEFRADAKRSRSALARNVRSVRSFVRSGRAGQLFRPVPPSSSLLPLSLPSFPLPAHNSKPQHHSLSEGRGAAATQCEWNGTTPPRLAFLCFLSLSCEGEANLHSPPGGSTIGANPTAAIGFRSENHFSTRSDKSRPPPVLALTMTALSPLSF